MNLVNSIVRGFGHRVGSNFANSMMSSNPTKSYRYYDRAQNEIEKALNFPIQGRADTVLGRCFNLLQMFEDECKPLSDSYTNILCLSTVFKYYNQFLRKTEDCTEYLELKGNEEETVEKIKELRIKATTVFKQFVIASSEKILEIRSGKEKSRTRSYWLEDWSGYKALKDVYISVGGNKADEIDEHLKSFWNKLLNKVA